MENETVSSWLSRISSALVIIVAPARIGLRA